MKGLALDGGGCFGAAQAEILSRITDITKFDFVAGTSVGAIVGAAVATRTEPEAFMNFFTEWAPRIFSGHKWRKYLPITPKYPDKQLLKALKTLFPMRFKDVNIPMFVTAADLNASGLKVFYSGDPDDGNMPLWEILRMAAAAETYFLPWRGFADAGIYANNPSMVAVAGAKSRFGVLLSDLELCSIGTGETTTNMNIGSTRFWTPVQWGLYILKAQLGGAANKMHAYFVSKLTLKKYLRIQFERDEEWRMDNPEVIGIILDKWSDDITRGVKAVDAF